MSTTLSCVDQGNTACTGLSARPLLSSCTMPIVPFHCPIETAAFFSDSGLTHMFPGGWGNRTSVFRFFSMSSDKHQCVRKHGIPSYKWRSIPRSCKRPRELWSHTEIWFLCRRFVTTASSNVPNERTLL